LALLALIVAIELGLLTGALWLAPNWLPAPRNLTASQELLRESNARTVGVAAVASLTVALTAFFGITQLWTSRRKMMSDRMSAAAELLDSESMLSRGAAIHALSAVGIESPGDREEVLDLISEFVRNSRTSDRTPQISSSRAANSGSETSSWLEARRPDIDVGFKALGALQIGRSGSRAPGRRRLIIDADLSNGFFVNLKFEEYEFYGCVMSGSVFRDCEFRSCTIRDCEFDEVSFESSLISRTEMSDCRFNNGSFEGVVLEHSTFVDCNMRGAELLNCRLRQVNLIACDIVGVTSKGGKHNEVEVTGCAGADRFMFR
jgi:uncharacterized protein YjbI with pentapeptide repeats